jgi:hypothetical protein
MPDQPLQEADCQFATPGEIAQAFHEAYERGAEYFGYKTRPESAVSWEDVPENNKALMIATVRGVLIERRMVVKGGPLVQALGDARLEAEALAEALESVSDLRSTWPSAMQALADYRARHPKEPTGVGKSADAPSEPASGLARHPKETP